MKWQFNKYIVLIISLLLSMSMFAQTDHATKDEAASKQQVYIGNKAYMLADYPGAIKAYEQALSFHGNYYKAHYNLAAALYHTEVYDTSRLHNEKVISSLVASKLLKAKAHHNIGNTYLKEKNYEAAIDAFKQSLRLVPNSYNTKYNLAYAQKMLQQQQQDKQNNKDNQDKENNQDQNQDQNQEDSKDNQDQDQQDPSNKNKPNNAPEKPQDQQAPPPQQSKISKEQAEAILNAMRQNESALQQEQRKEKGIPVRMEKDW